jgi:hypothetical protein
LVERRPPNPYVGSSNLSSGPIQNTQVDRTRGVQQPSKLKIAEFDSPYLLHYWVLSSAVEQRPYKAKVGGSIPPGPTSAMLL